MGVLLFVIWMRRTQRRRKGNFGMVYKMSLLLVIAFAHRFKKRLSELHDLAVAIQDVEAGIQTDEALLLPSRNRPAVARAFLVGPRRHAFTIGADVAAIGGADAH